MAPERSNGGEAVALIRPVRSYRARRGLSRTRWPRSESTNRRLSDADALFRQIRVATTLVEKDDILHMVAQGEGPVVVSFLNAHGANLAWSDPGFMKALLSSHVLLRDGIGVAILMRWLDRDPGLNLNGTDLIPEILRMHADRRIALAGTTTPSVERAARHLHALHGCNVVATIDGFRSDETYALWAKNVKPDILILGMGMPKQERIAVGLQAHLDHPCMIVNGGAVLDFIAGRVTRAPVWIRAARMEWIYRLTREPSRLWRRYLLGNPLFLARALRLRFWKRRQMRGARPPLDHHSHRVGQGLPLMSREVPGCSGESDEQEGHPGDHEEANGVEGDVAREQTAQSGGDG
jgi:exopolysaccharide biosynthesis WecB/TagA/CpsF family protein